MSKKCFICQKVMPEGRRVTCSTKCAREYAWGGKHKAEKIRQHHIEEAEVGLL